MRHGTDNPLRPYTVLASRTSVRAEIAPFLLLLAATAMSMGITLHCTCPTRRQVPSHWHLLQQPICVRESRSFRSILLRPFSLLHAKALDPQLLHLLCFAIYLNSLSTDVPLRRELYESNDFERTSSQIPVLLVSLPKPIFQQSATRTRLHVGSLVKFAQPMPINVFLEY